MNQGTLQELFLQLVRLPSPSGQERQVADFCRAHLQRIGARVTEDEAGTAIAGNCGNLLAVLPGDTDLAPVVLCTHMDTVGPFAQVRPVVDEQGVVRSDGTTILGADDKAGIAALFAALDAVRTGDRRHGPIEVLLTVGEEIGLRGSEQVQRGQLQSTIGLCLDSGGRPGTMIVAGPSQAKWEAVVHGRSAHAGVAPEQGLSAIRMAAQAVNQMPHGRIDEETTVNIGSFVGEGPTNVVSDLVRLLGEARSRDETKLDSVLQQLERAFESTVNAVGGSVEFWSNRTYPGFQFGPDSVVRRRVQAAMLRLGLQPVPVQGGGGSDANRLTAIGIETLNVGIGYEAIHSHREQIAIADIAAVAAIAAEFCCAGNGDLRAQ